jgi:hypothetical protein
LVLVAEATRVRTGGHAYWTVSHQLRRVSVRGDHSMTLDHEFECAVASILLPHTGLMEATVLEVGKSATIARRCWRARRDSNS